MRVETLRWFLAVVEEGNVTRAAERLHLSQPGLSTAIRRLELELGQPLLHRHARGVDMTFAGERLLPRARRIVAEADRLAAEPVDEEAGRYVVGVHDTGLGAVQAPLLAALRTRHPQVEIKVRTLPYDELPRALADREADAVLTVAGDGCMLGGRLHPLWTEPAVLAVAAQHPLAAAEALAVADVLDEPVVHCGDAPAALQAPFQLAAHRNGERPRLGHAADPRSCLDLYLGIALGEGVLAFGATEAASVRFPGLATVPLVDAAPLTAGVVTAESPGPLDDDLVRIARRLTAAGMHPAGARPA